MADNQREKNLRLLEIRKILGLKQKEFADILKINRANLSKIENLEENRSVPKDTFYILNEKYNLNKEWWETGDGEMFLSDQTNANLVSNNPQTIELPLISISARASFDYEVFNDNNGATETAPVYTTRINGLKKPVLIDVDGDSMGPQLKAGTRVLADEVDCSDWQYITGVVAVFFKKQFVVKRIKENHSIQTNTITLHSDNETGGVFTVAMNDIIAIWKVIKIVDSNIE